MINPLIIPVVLLGMFGWCYASAALVLFILCPSWLMSIMFFFAAQVVALEIACSWYASRCMRKLAIVAYPVEQ